MGRWNMLALEGSPSRRKNFNSDLKPTGPPGWELVIGLTTLFRKNTHVMSMPMEEINTTGCDGLPESWKDTCMNDSGES